jgi:hypothetical protein
MFGQERLDAVGAQSAPMHVGEQRIRMVTRWFLEPGFEGAARVRGQWRTSLLPSLADTSHMGPDAEMDGIPVEIDQFGKAQAGLDCEQQQGVIAASKPCCAIGGGQKRFDLGSRQEMYLTLVMAFTWYREDALDKRTVGRFLEGNEPEEGVNGGQAEIARSGADASLCLEIGKERADEWCIEIIDDQIGGRLAEPRLCKPEQQPERVPIGCDRVATDVALAHEPLRKVPLDQRGDITTLLHGAASHR